MFYKTQTTGDLTRNIFSLLSVQFANYVIPMLTLPYLVRVLGPEKYGLIAFSLGICGVLGILIDYGFNLSATSKAAIHRENQKCLSELYSSVFVIKTIALLISLIVLCLLIVFVKRFEENKLLHLVTFGVIFGQMLVPTWLFQGIGKLVFISFLNLSSRVIYLICIFVFVSTEDDYIIVAAINSVCYMVIGIISVYIVSNKFNIKLSIPTYAALRSEIISGWDIFVSGVSTSVYTSMSPVILGFFTDNSTLGYYSAAEKIIVAVKGIWSPFSQVLYPHVTRLIHYDKAEGAKLLMKLFVLVGIIMIIVSGALFLFSDVIVEGVLGSKYYESAAILKILAATPLLVALSGITCIFTLLNYGYTKEYRKIYLFVSAIGLFMLMFFSSYYGAIGAAAAVFTIEAMVLAFSIVVIVNKNIFK